MGSMLGLDVKKDKAAERRLKEQQRKEEARKAEELSDAAERRTRNAGGSQLVKTTEMGVTANTNAKKTKLSGIV